jgi:integrase
MMKLENLIEQVMAVLETKGYTENTWKCAFRNGRFSSIRQYFSEQGKADFDTETAEAYIEEIHARYEKGQLSLSRAWHLKKLARWLIEFHETGKFSWHTGNRSKLVVNPYFRGVLNNYLDFMNGRISASSMPGLKSEILHFMDFLQNEKAYSDFLNVSLKDVQDFIAYICRRRRVDHIVYVVRYFLLYLKDNGIIQADLSPALYHPAKKPLKLLSALTREESENILVQPDRNTKIGKRDYAILMFGKYTGLRISDVIRIKLTDIDWSKGAVSITQSKNETPLVLPLTPETQEAIRDYIQNSRPLSDSPVLFLRHNAPVRPLSSQCITDIFSKYRAASGIDYDSRDGKGFHGFRRSIATWMLEADVPLTTISQVLGHRRMDSTSRYLTMDEKNLCKCALSLSGIEVTAEGLQ